MGSESVEIVDPSHRSSRQLLRWTDDEKQRTGFFVTRKIGV